MIVAGDEITIDLTGSNAEVPTGYNVPFEGSLLVGAYYAVRTILLDEVTFPEHVPQNDGVFRPVKVIAPKGTIYNPTFPRACFSRFCQVQRVVDNTILALADALPEGVTAGNSAGIHFCAYSGFSEEMGEYWLYLEVNEGSYGGRHGKDAMDSVDNLMANTRNNPIEELDLRFPIRCDQYELRPEPAAPGRWRGGIGIIRRNRFLVDGVYSCEGDRQTDPPRGIFGGWDGLVASCRKNPDTSREEVLPAKVTGIPFAAGEYIEFREPNAAGYGDPLDRPAEAVREDVLDDFTTLELARDAYGVVFADERTLELDGEATEELRRRAPREPTRDVVDGVLLRPARPLGEARLGRRERRVRDDVSAGPPRDLVGYGADPPDPRWPGGKRARPQPRPQLRGGRREHPARRRPRLRGVPARGRRRAGDGRQAQPQHGVDVRVRQPGWLLARAPASPRSTGCR